MTTITVGVAEAHNRLSELIDQALNGTEVVIAKRFQPVVRLAPLDDAKPGPNGGRAVAVAEAYLAAHGPGMTDEEVQSFIEEERQSWRRGARMRIGTR